MNVLLVQLDGKLPNIALMRIAAHHRELGDDVTLRHGGERGLWDADWDKVYASAIFEKTAPAVERLRREYPSAILGGSGISKRVKVEHFGVTTKRQDYSLYPDYQMSIGFTQRGCRLKCGFCGVTEMEGDNHEENTVAGLWRGDPWPRELHLLDNDFFGQRTPARGCKWNWKRSRRKSPRSTPNWREARRQRAGDARRPRLWRHRSPRKRSGNSLPLAAKRSRTLPRKGGKSSGYSERSVEFRSLFS